MNRKGRGKIFLLLKEEQINLLDLRSYTDTKQRLLLMKKQDILSHPRLSKYTRQGLADMRKKARSVGTITSRARNRELT